MDSNYRFTYIDVGAYGRTSDGGVYGASSLGQALEANSICLPPPSKLRGTDTVLPYVFVGDDAFPLRQYMMKPYSQRNLQPE